MKTKLQSLGFTSGHVHLLLVAVAIFGILIVAKTDINIKAIFAQADDKQEILTYEQVYGQVLADEDIETDSAVVTQQDEKQMALLDRSLDNGQVLGDDIGIGTIPKAEDLYSSQELNEIYIKGTLPTTTQTVQEYADRMLRIESYYDTTEMFSNLNSSDPEIIKDTATKTSGIIDSMGQIFVPSELVEYHKYKILYYQTITAIGNSFSGQEGDLASYSKTFFSLMNKITSIENWVNSEYKVTL